MECLRPVRHPPPSGHDGRAAAADGNGDDAAAAGDDAAAAGNDDGHAPTAHGDGDDAAAAGDDAPAADGYGRAAAHGNGDDAAAAGDAGPASAPAAIAAAHGDAMTPSSSCIYKLERTSARASSRRDSTFASLPVPSRRPVFRLTPLDAAYQMFGFPPLLGGCIARFGCEFHDPWYACQSPWLY